METLWLIWSILSFFFLQLVSLGQESGAPTPDTDVGIDLSGNNSETTSTEKEYGPRSVSIYSLSYLTDLREGSGYVTLTCRADCNPRCDRYRIYHDGRVLSDTNVIYITKDRTKSGKYRCGAYDIKSGRYVRSAEVDIDIKYGPSNVVMDSSNDLTDLWEGKGYVTLTCRADCNPRCGIYRIYHDGRVLYNTNVAYITKDRTKSGKYSCGAYDFKSGRYARSAEVTINVKYGPKNVILQYSSDYEDLLEGKGNLMLTCSAACNPLCNKYIIYHDEKVISTRNVKSIEKNRKNSGKYKCAAYDVKLKKYARSVGVDIDFKYKDVFLSSKEKEMPLRINKSLPSNIVCTVECNFECDSDIKVMKDSKWYRNINSNKSIFSDRKAILSDSGIYRCTSGTSQSNDFKLNILYGPRNTRVMDSQGNVNSEIVLRESSPVYYELTCSSKCNPRCNISWYKDEKILYNEKSETMDFINNRNQSGTYQCVAGGVEGNLPSNAVKIIVQYLPRTVQITPSNYTFYTRRNGTPITDIICQADCLPTCNYEWERVWGYPKLFNEGSILFAKKNFTYHRSRTFECAASNSIGKKYSSWIIVSPKDGPTDVRINEEGLKRENHPFELQCSADCYHGCLSFTWFHKNEEIHSGQNLKFNNLSRKDNGEYTCKVNDYFGTDSDSNTVKVKFGPSIVRIHYNTSDGNLKENITGLIYITCEAVCNPPCSFTFYKNGQRIRYRQRENQLERLKIKSNSGQYSCSAENPVIGGINSSNFAVILILYKPRLSRSGIIPTDITAPESVKLNFSIKSLPPSNVTVVHRGKILKYDTNVTGSKSYQIKITSCLDEGDYIIGAKNDVGSDEYRNRVTVKCSPMILKYSDISNKGYNIGDPLNLTTTFVANPAPDVSWSFTSYKSRNVSQKVEENLIHNKDMTSIIVDKLDVDNFGIYQLTLVNDFGNETMSFSIKGPPQPPTALTLDCLSAVFLEWKPGFDGGTDQSFLIEYTTNLSSPWSPHSELSITSKDNDRMSTYVTLMNPMVRHFFRVISENVFGRVISDKIVNCTLQPVGEEESFLRLDTIAGISGGLVLILVAILVLVLFGVKKYQNHHRKGQKARNQNAAQEEDCGMGMIENTLYISGDNVKTSTILSSNYSPNDNTESRNDVYSVVKKTEKIEPYFPMYAEVCKSRPVKDKPAIKKKPAKKTKNSTGKTVNKDGLVYVEIDLKNTPALSGNSVIHGSDNKTLYVDIDFTQHA